MQAIVSIQSAQYPVRAGDKIAVNRIKNAKPGDVIEFDKVLLISDGDKTLIGAPIVKNAKVVAEVMSQKRGPKVISFKRRAKKGYKRIRGHRQDITELKIKEIKHAGGDVGGTATLS